MALHSPDMNASDDTETSVSNDKTDESRSNNNNDVDIFEAAFGDPGGDGGASGTNGADEDSSADQPLTDVASDVREKLDELLRHDAAPNASDIAYDIADNGPDHDDAYTAENVLEVIKHNYEVDDDNCVVTELSGVECAMASADEDTPPEWETIRHMFALTAQDLPKFVGGKEIKSPAEARKRAQYMAAARLEFDHDWAYFLDENYGLDSFRWYNPESGMYEKKGENTVFALLDEHLEEFANSSEQKEIVKKLRVRTRVDRDCANAGGANKVLVQNGVLNTETWELEEIAPEYYFTRRLNARWDPDVETGEVEEFLRDLVREDYHVDILCEMAGDTLSPHYRRAWFGALYGPGGNGKSKFLRLIRETLDGDNTTAQKLDKIINGDYAMGHIAGGFGTLANLVPEVDVRKVENANPIKELTGDDTVGMRDIYGDPYEGVNYSKLVIATNEPLIFTERTNAIVRRIKPLKLPFEFKFEGDYDPENPNHKRADPELEQWLYTEDNYAAFLQLMAEGLQRLRENNAFSYERSQQEMYDDYQRAADPFFAWWDSCLENHRGDWTDTGTPLYLENDQIYSMYKSYVEAKGRKAMKERSFWSEFNAISGLEMEKYRPSRADGSRTRKYIVPTDTGFHYLNTSGLKDFSIHSDIEIPDSVGLDDVSTSGGVQSGNNHNSSNGGSSGGGNGGVSNSERVLRAIQRQMMRDAGGPTIPTLAGAAGLAPDVTRDAIGELMVDGRVVKQGDEYHTAPATDGGDAQ